MRIAVYTGSASGVDPRFAETARSLGRTLAERGIGLVYGGGRVGLMGEVADAVLAAGGEAVGVMPSALVNAEIAHLGLTELHVVADMHERKAKMIELADAFIALPGGTGTLEELFEVWTWLQLGMHDKPVTLLDVADYWRPLTDMLDHMVTNGFVRQAQRDTLLHAHSVEDALAQLLAWEGAPPKWPAPAPVVAVSN
ncbi:TIGR00730 family Rossman fold protein [Pseudonocardiaceae bacterium YIM PH 21723]|nr:TIGR00730 family Rossman fold protein [Pseudonocardiaceae bacterium YIM PH 21723]